MAQRRRSFARRGGIFEQIEGAPAQFVQHALDLDELARMEHEGAATLIVLRVPFFQGPAQASPYAFAFTLAVSVALSLVVALIFRRKDWF